MASLSHLVHGLALASLVVFSNAFGASDPIESSPPFRAATLSFGGIDYVHRWSKDSQNEFTPERDSDLARWHDMVTINVHSAVASGD